MSCIKQGRKIKDAEKEVVRNSLKGYVIDNINMHVTDEQIDYVLNNHLRLFKTVMDAIVFDCEDEWQDEIYGLIENINQLGNRTIESSDVGKTIGDIFKKQIYNESVFYNNELNMAVYIEYEGMDYLES